MISRILYGALACLLAVKQLQAEPVDMTGLQCVRENNYGTQTWQFFGEMGVRYYQDGSRSTLKRVGHGAYERLNTDGEWRATYYFFDEGAGLYVRILAKPGLLTLMENPNAPLETAVVPFSGNCSSLSSAD